MKNYKIILFDLDDTLIDTEKTKNKILIEIFKKRGYILGKRELQICEETNKQIWREYDKGIITLEQLYDTRFKKMFNNIGYDIEEKSIEIEDEYKREQRKNIKLIPGAENLCKILSQKCDIYIITNGKKEYQWKKIEAVGLEKYVKGIFASSEMRKPKPSIEFYEDIKDRIRKMNNENTLIVGNSLKVDIQFGINSRVDTVWYNPENEKNETDIKSTYEIHKLEEILNIIK